MTLYDLNRVCEDGTYAVCSAPAGRDPHEATASIQNINFDSLQVNATQKDTAGFTAMARRSFPLASDIAMLSIFDSTYNATLG